MKAEYRPSEFFVVTLDPEKLCWRSADRDGHTQLAAAVRSARVRELERLIQSQMKNYQEGRLRTAEIVADNLVSITRLMSSLMPRLIIPEGVGPVFVYYHDALILQSLDQLDLTYHGVGQDPVLDIDSPEVHHLCFPWWSCQMRATE